MDVLDTVPASVALIGDVVSSRQASDQDALFTQLNDTLDWLNVRIPALQPLQVTIGDEFQGVYQSYQEVTQVTLLLALKLGVDIELRFGIGWGEVTTHEPERIPFGQSGTAWWNARMAIDKVAQLVGRKQWPRSLRQQAIGFEQDALLNAYFLCRDELLINMDARDRRIALGLFCGEKQQEIAQSLGISQPSVAKRQKEKGINALFRAQEMLEGALE